MSPVTEREQAFAAILAACEFAIGADVEPHERGQLVRLHEDALRLAGRDAGPRVSDLLQLDRDVDDARYRRRREAFDGPGGLSELRPYFEGRTLPAFRCMWDSESPELQTVAQVRAWADTWCRPVFLGQQTDVPGIGPFRFRAILAALDAHDRNGKDHHR